ncbi:MAG: Hsp20/alpha crystallin family protein [Betaproteobacteria bacterium]|nr:Hsp20/alpha crystallin family protein [Betaproteobacteria bacterium]
MYRTWFPSDLIAELERLQRQGQRLAGPASSLRGVGRNGFPAINIGGTPDSVEIYAFAPGLDPATVEVTVERGVLTLSGQRSTELPVENKTSAVHINERFTGRFSRAVSLSDDLDSERVSAKYSDGVLHISVKRKQSAQPRRIEIH